jgi:hypothetical protein
MCKLIETSDLDNAITAALGDDRSGKKGNAIDLLASEELETLSERVASASVFTAPITQASHTLKLGILIGLKLAETQLALGVA